MVTYKSIHIQIKMLINKITFKNELKQIKLVIEKIFFKKRNLIQLNKA